ncbi:phosphoribosylglycinamide formyltransferase [Saccharibacillus sp. O23]|uniref:phosphoribosylglycinamide formyltransferase n=1 Tax=Saccharibacillus sp. O23 TaxID=2009338 RepID=UPI0026CAFAEA|nr:phosphoribosylglycinamide formyltransferase [Saccharibacillus sp. O23]
MSRSERETQTEELRTLERAAASEETTTARTETIPADVEPTAARTGAISANAEPNAVPSGSDEQVPLKPGPMPGLPTEPQPVTPEGTPAPTGEPLTLPGLPAVADPDAEADLDEDPAAQLLELEETLPRPDGPVIDRPYRIAVFASGSGSNFQALLDASRAGNLGAQIALLVCDKPQAKAVERARAAGVPVFVFTPKEYESREAYERVILEELERAKIDLIVLAGYMRLITSMLVEPYSGRMINIHPSLLPSFPGKDAAGQAVEHGVRVSGATVHFVDGGMDTGPIIAQRAVEVMPEDTATELQARIQETERLLYPEVVSWFAAGRVKLEGRRVVLF